jgi:sensor histidine kinase regulating citrate/malate metabolism
MASITKALIRIVGLSFIITVIVSFLYFSGDNNAQFRDQLHEQFLNQAKTTKTSTSLSEPLLKDTLKNLSLSDPQCKAAFPDLTRDIDRMVRRGKFKFRKSDPDYKGLVQGRIHNNKVPAPP